MAGTSNHAQIPLKCNICPKRPLTFSDVSHLLTHVGSKGHLSSYYKTKVQAQTDQDAAARMAEYDAWYNKYDIEGLMSDRFQFKDKKKRANSARQQPQPSTRLVQSNYTAPSYTAPSGFNAVNMPFRDSRHSSATLPSSYFNSPASNAPSLPARMPQVNGVDGRHTNMTNHAYTSAAAFPRAGFNVNRRDSPYAEFAGQQLGSFQPRYPDPPRQNGFGQTMQSNHSPHTPSATRFQRERENDASAAVGTGNAVLKGVLWPGMDIFDSATPIAKRRRNQKKDASVLDQLSKNSLLVEPVETITYPDGTVKKVKEITGFPSSSSPLMSPANLWGPDVAKASMSSRFNSYDDDGIAQQVAMGMTPSVKKRSFDVFQDETDHGRARSFGDAQNLSLLTRAVNPYGQENGVQDGFVKRDPEDASSYTRQFMSNSSRMNSGLGYQPAHQRGVGSFHGQDAFSYHPQNAHFSAINTQPREYGSFQVAHDRRPLPNPAIGDMGEVDFHPMTMAPAQDGSFSTTTDATVAYSQHENQAMSIPATSMPMNSTSMSDEVGWANFWEHGESGWSMGGSKATAGPKQADEYQCSDGVPAAPAPTPIQGASDDQQAAGNEFSAPQNLVSAAQDDDARTITAPATPHEH